MMSNAVEGLTNDFIEDKKIMTYESYQKSPNILKRLKREGLKEIARYYKLFVTGTKIVLIDRIEQFFLRSISSVKIQRIFRGHIVREIIQWKGDRLSKRESCVNESDFHTLEPLGDIPYEYFYKFRCGNVIYGCNIISLIHLMQSKSAVKNPYNRENFSPETVENIKRVYRLIRIVFGLPADAPEIKKNTCVHQTVITRTFMNVNHIVENRMNQMRTIWDKTVEVRIRDLFIEMDHLGNYTHSQWFTLLDRREYIQFYRTLYEIWSFRGSLTRETKMMICILGDPFHSIYRGYIHETTLEVLREICLRIMENMVYGGIDDEYRKIGTLHVLTALTSVSVGARTSLPWLYEIIQ